MLQTCHRKGNVDTVATCVQPTSNNAVESHFFRLFPKLFLSYVSAFATFHPFLFFFFLFLIRTLFFLSFFHPICFLSSHPLQVQVFFSPHRSSFFFFLFTSVVQLLLPSSESLPFFFFSFFLASFSFFPPPLCYCTALLLLRYIPSSFFFEARKEEKKENRGDFYTRKPSCVPACRKQLKYI